MRRLKVGDRVRTKSGHRRGDLMGFFMESGINTHGLVRFDDDRQSEGVAVDINDLELDADAA